MGKIILKKHLNDKYSNKKFEELVIWVKKKAYKKNTENWSLDHGKRLEPELATHYSIKYITLLTYTLNKINLRHRERECGNIIISKVKKRLDCAPAILFIPLTYKILPEK